MPSRFARLPRCRNGGIDVRGAAGYSQHSSQGAWPRGRQTHGVEHARPLSLRYTLFGLLLVAPGGAYLGDEPWVGSVKVLEIAPAVIQAEVTVYGSAYCVRITIILSVILPPADLAELECLRHRERLVAATLAAGRRARHSSECAPVRGLKEMSQPGQIVTPVMTPAAYSADTKGNLP